MKNESGKGRITPSFLIAAAESLCRRLPATSWIIFSSFRKLAKFDPATGTFSATTNYMATARRYHTATLLPNGKVLIAAGRDTNVLWTVELYDPATDTFSTTGSISAVRENHAATRLPNGKVLITGGDYGGTTAPLSSAELFQ